MSFKSSNLKAIALASTTSFSAGSLIITGLGDPDGGDGDILELYATVAIPDLSIYGLEKTANANTSSGSPGLTLPAVALGIGDFFYVTTDQVDFTQFLGFAADLEWSGLGINGNDSVILYQSGAVIDTVLEDGSSSDIHGDGWIYRNDTEGPNTTFIASEWTSETNVLANSNDSTNAASSTPMPVGTYAVPEPSSALLGLIGAIGILRRRR